MIEQNALKPIRKVAIADHLWACFEQMASEMGSDRDALVNQALFMFARLNGFMVPGAVAGAPSQAGTASLAAVKSSPRPAPVPPREPEPEEEEAAPEAEPEGEAENQIEEEEAAEPEPEEEPEPPPPPPPTRRPGPPAPPSSSGRRGSDPDDLGPPVRAPSRAEPARAVSETPAPSKPMDDDPVRREVAERVLETAAELERLIKGKSEPAKPSPALVNSDATNNGANSGEKLLYITSDDGELLKVAKERFLIGRGKHCDFVINSGKVSREHAAIVRDGPEFFIEDLGSSNGTWFNKQRIKRRKIEDGDEYFICSEKVRCLFR